MKLSRRNVLAGLGGLAVGGGALLGSGAFSSVTAQRDVEVNVTTDIVNAESPPDVLIDVDAYPEIAVADGIDGNILTPSNLSPSESELTAGGGTGTGLSGDSYVSLVAEDVTIVFGYEDSSGTTTDDLRLPANSLVTFNGLIGFAQGSDASDPSDPADIAFESEVGTSDLTDSTVEFVDGGANPSGSTDYPENVTTAAGSSQFYDVSVDTNTLDDSAEKEFGIAIGDADVSTIF